MLEGLPCQALFIYFIFLSILCLKIYEIQGQIWKHVIYDILWKTHQLHRNNAI